MSKKLNSFEHEQVTYLETTTVNDRVSCDVYTFADTTNKDLGIVTIKPHGATPLQKVIQGEQTIEQYISGVGTLSVTSPLGHTREYIYPGDTSQVEVDISETMQWNAGNTELIFAEICYPPYQDGRFEEL